MADNSTGGGGVGADAAARQRRGSITQAALSQLFNRGNSVNGAPSSAGAAADAQRRRLSVTTLGLSGGQGTQPPSFNMRRSSMSTNSDSIDETAVEDDDDGVRTNPTTPFTRRMSFGGTAMRYRPGGSPGNDQQGFNWSEQLRSRAESSVSGARPSVSLASTSPPRASAQHDRSKSVAEMPQPPAQTPQPKPEARKPDAFQERILKGDFYMD